MQDEVQNLELLQRFLFLLWRTRHHVVDVGRRGGCGNAKKIAQGLNLVLQLNFFRVVDVRRIEQLGAVKEDVDLSLGLDDFLDPGRFLTLPVRTGQQEAARFITGCSATDLSKAKGLDVDELDRIVTVLRDFRDRQNQRCRSKIPAQKGVRRVRVRRLDRGVGRGVNAGNVDDRVWRTLVFGRARLEEILLVDAVAIDDRKAIDGGFLGNRPSFCQCHILRLCERGEG